METVIIELQADLKQANKALAEMRGQLDSLTKQQKKNNSLLAKMGRGFKGVGLALKGLGIGVILKLFDGLYNAFMANQQAADFFRKAGITLQLMFKDLIALAAPLTETLSGAFTNPIQALKDFGQAVVDYVINYFNQAMEAAGHLGKALMRLVNFDLGGAVQEFKNAGSDMVDAFVGVEEGGVEVVKEALEAVTEYVEELPGKIDKAAKTADKLVAAQKAAAEAEIERQRVQLEMQRTEEQLRQIRDDEFRSIQDRQDANTQLLAMLEEQEQAERNVINLRIEAARLAYQSTKSHENLLELRRAELELVDLVERLEGQRSEALVNRVGLEKELLDIQRSKAETEEEIEQTLEQNRINRIKNEYDRTLEQQKLETEAHIKRLERFDEERLRMTLAGQQGTAAYQELLNEMAKADAEYESKAADNTLKLEQLKHEARVSTAQATLSTVANLFGQESAAGKAASIAQATINTYEAFTSALSTPAPIPIPQIAAANALAAGFAAVRDIVSTPIPNKFGGGGSSGGAVAQPAMPSVSVMANTGRIDPNAQIADSLKMMNDKPVRAYVVSDDVQTGLALNRKLDRSRTL